MWNRAVSARLTAWIAAMVYHANNSAYLDDIAGVVFPETAVPDDTQALLDAADYVSAKYLTGLEANMAASLAAGPTYLSIVYIAGGFHPAADSNGVAYKDQLADWPLAHEVGLGNLIWCLVIGMETPPMIRNTKEKLLPRRLSKRPTIRRNERARSRPRWPPA